MEQFMIDMMLFAMPAMKPLVWAGLLVAAGGLVLLLLRQLLDDKNGWAVLLAGRIMLGLAVFFIACEIAGMWLGMPPKINFGDFSKMEFILVPFWQIAILCFIAALVLGFFGGRRYQAQLQTQS